MVPEPEQMLAWVAQQFGDSAEAVDARVDGAGGVQLVAVQTIGDLKVTIR